ncbi:MAG: chloride channel protein [Promethearchaeota archaeon]
MGISLKWHLTYSALKTSIKIAVRWIILASLIGFLVGLAIIIFRTSLNIFISLSSSLELSFLIYLFPTIGIVASIFLVQKFTVEKRGHGANSFIESYHTHWGEKYGTDTLVKTIASILTLGSGGSAGPEGPSIEVGGGLASTLSKILHIPLKDAKLISLCGVAAAIGAVFHAPISGCLFSCEIPYRDDIEYRALFPCFVSSIIGYLTSAQVFRERLIPTVIPAYDFALTDMPYFIVLGILIGIIGLLFTHLFYGINRLFSQLNVSSYNKGIIGGLSVGGLAFLVALYIGNYMEGSILGIGYDVIGFLVYQPYVVSENLMVTLIILLLLLLGKMFATAITLGSGGVGGTVAPSFFIGAVLGAIVGILLGFYPSVMVVVSSIAFFAAIAHIPITGVMLAAEIHGFDFVIPAGLATLIGHFIARGDNLYRTARVGKEEKVKVLPKYRHIP